MKTQDWLPVVASILVIILVAVLEKHSRLIAAITATMPIGIPLGIWIVYSASRGDSAATTEFTQGTMLGILPTLGFILTAWLVARSGGSLAKIMLSGYGVWGIGALLVVAAKRYLLG